jgi:hypothetical protein
MHTDRFDDFARRLASGKLTPQSVLAGLFGGLRGRGGGAGTQPPAEGPAATAYKVYLPFVQKPCTTKSTCEQKQYCSSDQTCRCLLSAEGEIRCGQIPSCAVPYCTTSKDCAHLGEGYFCDTPNSGCCNDADRQRCIAPCTADCPADRKCGSICCPPGQTCVNGACAAPPSNTWTGTATYQSQTITVRFVLEESAGSLSGRLLMRDPKTLEYLETGEITGTRSGTQATWTTEAGSQVRGTFSGSRFTGTITFPAVDADPALTATLSLSNTAAVSGAALAVDSY